jgi:alkylhydroperoxidase/carboxymuconolactone decarboxylase family protein YurZ
MAEKGSISAEDRKWKAEEIYKEILDLIKGRKNSRAIHRKHALSTGQEKLIALSSVLATEQGPEIVASCVHECLHARATPAQIMQVVDQAILMAEIPACVYRTVVREAIEDFRRR